MNCLHGAICRAAAFLAMLSCDPTAFAALPDESTYRALIQAAQHKQHVAVQINLDIDVPMQVPSAALRTRIASLERQVLEDLRGAFLPSSVWRNGLGQLGVLASLPGIEMLANHSGVRSIMPDNTRRFRQGVYDVGGHLNLIEAEISAHGYANVDVIENLENFAFDVLKDGSVRYRSSALQRMEIASRRLAFLRSLPASGFVDLESAIVRATNMSDMDIALPKVALRLNRDGFFHLIEHPYVRAIRLANDELPDPAPQIDPQALVHARRDGAASVIVDLQRFAPYTPLKGKLAPQAWLAQQEAIRDIYFDILDPLDPTWTKKSTSVTGIASLTVTLSFDALNAISRNPDPRIRSLTLNLPTGVAALAQSTVQINTRDAYQGGYRGAGQSIAILDTGVLSTHPFLKDANGNSRVWLEGCFGTSGSNSFGSFYSICPGPDANGDSFGPGTASPYSSTRANNYWHGTHVAGIAAGRGGPGGINGVAPDARIISAQIFSASTYGSTNIAPGDIGQALHVLSTLNDRNITVNLSVAFVNYFSQSTGACDNTVLAVHDNIALLNSLNIPVVIATGNDWLRGKIAWPACVSGAIKVGSVNDVTALASEFSNNPNPDTMVGPIFMAPGDLINSSVPTTRDATGFLQSCPPRQNSCRPDRTDEEGAMMDERVGTIRTSIQGQSGGEIAAAGERSGGSCRA